MESFAAGAAVFLLAALQFWFMILEMVFWTKPLGLRAFGQSSTQAESSKVLAANQGLYNGFLAVGLIWSLVHPSHSSGREIAIFFSSCVLVAGLYGAYTASRKILYVQALPALAALLLVIFL